MDVKVITNTTNAEWDKFVETSGNGTIFHKLKFLSYHPQERFNFLNLMFYNGSKLVSVLPGSLEDGVFKSPTGASYGSFVYGKLNFSETEDLITTFFDFAKNYGIKEIFLTPPPIYYLCQQQEAEQFLLLYKGFKLKQSLITHVLDLGIIEKGEDILYKTEKRFRTDVNKSLKTEMSVEINNDFDSFYKILLENKKKFDTKPTHSYEELVSLSRLFPDEVKLMMAYDKLHNPVAGIVFFSCNASTVLTFYISHYYEHRELKAVSRLLYETARWAKEHNHRWLDLGVSMDTASQNPMEPSRTLINFKESVGAKGFLRTTYHYNLKNPL